MMQLKIIQSTGILLTILYGAFIIWLYWTEPKTIAEIPAKATVTVGTYEINREKFDEGLRLFRAENYRAARENFSQADPEKRDARTQFYVAYSFYREGWGRTWNDDNLFRQGLETANKAIALDPNFKSDDADLKLKTAVELKTELEQGVERSWDDLNPLKVLRERK
jgi:tetratricopeptide (TPR) repeat protein